MAQYNLGFSYLSGEGVAKDINQTIYWYKLSAEQGFAPAQSGLGNRYFYGDGLEQNYSKAVSLFMKAAEQGDIE